MEDSRSTEDWTREVQSSTNNPHTDEKVWARLEEKIASAKKEDAKKDQEARDQK